MEQNASAGADALGGANTGAETGADLTPQETSAEEKAKAFRALIRGEYRAQYAEETQKLINRRFKETEKLRQRVKELEDAARAAEGVGPYGEMPGRARDDAERAVEDAGPYKGGQTEDGRAVEDVGPYKGGQTEDGRAAEGVGPYGEMPGQARDDAERAAEGVGPYGEMPGRARDDAQRAAEGVGPYGEMPGRAQDHAARGVGDGQPDDTRSVGDEGEPSEARRGGACPSREKAEPPEDADRARDFAAMQSEAWLSQAAALRARQPDFDLDAMRADPTFALLLMHGAPLEQAWRAATVTERERAAAAEAERAVTADIRARGSRPPEAGSGAAPGFSLRPDVAGMSDGEVREVLARLAEKERISFG